MAANRRNKCGWQNTCEKVRLCTHCVTGKCKFCRHDNCNEICDQFTLEPQCERLKRFPYVCSNCSDIDNCKSPKYFYNARKAQDQRNYNVRDWKSGPKIPAEEMTKIVPIFEEGIKNQKISPDMLIHNKNLNISTSTAYRYIHNRYMGTVMPIDLKRAVGYKTYKSSRPVTMPIDYNFLEGRRYSDFCETLPDLAPGTNIWEMDTVLRKKGTPTCALTLLHRATNLQLYFRLSSCEMIEVQRIMDGIKKFLGTALFSTSFAVILTDNGSEFHDPLSLETDPNTGEKLIQIFYCLPRHSEQKGKCEKKP